MLQHRSVLHPFLWLKNTPLSGYSPFYASVYQLVDVWAVPTFWLLGIMLLRTFVYKFLCRHVFVSLGYAPGSGIAESYGNDAELF